MSLHTLDAPPKLNKAGDKAPPNAQMTNKVPHDFNGKHFLARKSKKQKEWIGMPQLKNIRFKKGL